jgi:hypothetical protein
MERKQERPNSRQSEWIRFRNRSGSSILAAYWGRDRPGCARRPLAL